MTSPLGSRSGSPLLNLVDFDLEAAGWEADDESEMVEAGTDSEWQWVGSSPRNSTRAEAIATTLAPGQAQPSTSSGSSLSGRITPPSASVSANAAAPTSFDSVTPIPVPLIPAKPAVQQALTHAAAASSAVKKQNRADGGAFPGATSSSSSAVARPRLPYAAAASSAVKKQNGADGGAFPGVTSSSSSAGGRPGLAYAAAASSAAVSQHHQNHVWQYSSPTPGEVFGSVIDVLQNAGHKVELIDRKKLLSTPDRLLPPYLQASKRLEKFFGVSYPH